jgi:putative ABC transport system permease protein
MEIGPILRSLFHHKTRFWLIVLEIALTLAIVANCLNMIFDERAEMLRPTGMDEENLLVAISEPFAPEFEDEDFVRASYQDDLRMMRALPGVRSASGIHAIPLSGGGSATGRRATGTDIDTLTAPYFVVGTDVLQTLGVELAEGRDFIESDWPDPAEEDEAADEEEAEPDLTNVILTREMADVLFPDGGALGGTIEDKGGSSIDTVVGIVDVMHGSWPTSSVAERVMLYPGEPWNMRRARYMIRTEPGMVEELYTTLETKLVALNEGRLVKVQTLKEYKDDTYRDVTAVTQMLGGLSVLLVVVTSLGIIGLTSFSVTQRTREIGTRRALGATRLAILRYFLLENWIITGMGLTLGIALTGAGSLVRRADHQRADRWRGHGPDLVRGTAGGSRAGHARYDGSTGHRHTKRMKTGKRRPDPTFVR